MASRVRAYAYSNAFVRALKSRLLTTAQYDSMLKAKNEQEALRSLLETVYSNYIKELIGETLNIKKLDDLIVKSFHDSYNRVINSIKDEFVKEVISKIYSKHKLDYLKTILKGLQSKMSPKEILEYFPDFLIQKEKDYLELINSRSLEEFIKKIKNGELKEFLELMIKEYEKTRNIVLAEILVDKHLYSKIWEFIQGLESIDKKVLESIIGTEIDLMNMDLIVRAKQLNLSESVIKDLILPIKYNLSEEIERALKASNYLESINAFMAGYYKKHLLEYGELAKKEKDVSIFEIGLKRFSAISNISSFIGYPFHAGVIVAYLNLKMLEAQDIRAILLGKRDGLESERIKKSLIMYGLI
jgi:V/A-type H+-transporting ATPase subunit C